MANGTGIDGGEGPDMYWLARYFGWVGAAIFWGLGIVQVGAAVGLWLGWIR